MIVPLVGQAAAEKTNELKASEVQVLIDLAEIMPKLSMGLFCYKCKTPVEGANGFGDPVWTLRCRCTTHQYRRRPV